MIALHFRSSSVINPRWLLLMAASAIALAAIIAVYFASGTTVIRSAFQSPPDDAVVLSNASGRNWFAAPNGRSDGDGSKQSPWDIATALGGGPRGTDVRPGDTIMLRGGVYKGAFTSRLQGRPDAPIQVRSLQNEWAILDKAAASRETAGLAIRGGNSWFRDFEVMNSFPDRSRLDPDGKMNPWRGSGINIWAPNTKLIDLVIHDNGHAIGLWNEDGGTEIYGCVIFNNGNNKKEHGIYGHNKTGTQTIRDNIIYDGAGYGLHIYANSSKSGIQGFDIQGNVIFNNGILMNDDQVADQILVGGVEGSPAGRIFLSDNHVYNRPDAPTSKNRGIRLGYEDRNNGDVRIFNNTIVSRVPLKVLWWHSIDAKGNTILSDGPAAEIETTDGASISNYRFQANQYLNNRSDNSAFKLNGEKANMAGWQKISFDRTKATDREQRVIIKPNKYDSGRATIVVYNWKLDKTVLADLSSFLRPGDKFEIRDAQNYLGEPLLQSTYNGRPVILPMQSAKIAVPIGNVEKMPVHTSPEFGVYMVLKK